MEAVLVHCEEKISNPNGYVHDVDIYDDDFFEDDSFDDWLFSLTDL